jgi:hypothetical protein
MKRLTVHLKKVRKDRVDGKSIIRNTLAYEVANEAEAMSILNMINDRKPKNNVAKWYISNIR